MDPLEEFRKMLLQGLALPGRAVTALGQKALPLAEAITPEAYKPQPAPVIPPNAAPGKIGGGEQTEWQKLLQTGLEGIGPGKAVGAAGTMGTLALLKKSLNKGLEGVKELATSGQLANAKALGLVGDYSKFGTQEMDQILQEAVNKVKSGTIEGKFDSLAAIQEQLKKSAEAYNLELKTNASNVSTASMLQKHNTEDLMQALKDTPEEAPMTFPWRAYLNGFNVPAYHGTVSPTDFSQFRFPVGELGAHFGTPKAAMERIAWQNPQDAAHRVYPLLLKPGKSLETPDLGSWGFDTVYDYLKQSGFMSVPEREAVSQNWGNMPMMRDYLTGKGYSSFNYINNVEHPGSKSWLMFKEDPASPQHISGIKSPWAKFKDLRSSDILASLAALGLAGTEFSKKKDPIPDNL